MIVQIKVDYERSAVLNRGEKSKNVNRVDLIKALLPSTYPAGVRAISPGMRTIL